LQSNNFLKIGAISILFAGICFAKARPAEDPSTARKGHVSKASRHTSSRHRTPRGAWKHHGQQAIQRDRAIEIQQALIRERYLDGAPSGEWDTRTQQAMSRYQIDNGWQSKITPDSRALIKLGLGPSHAQDIAQQGTDSATANASTTSGMVATTPSRR